MKIKHFASGPVPQTRHYTPRSHDFYPGESQVPLGDKDNMWNLPEEWDDNYSPQTDAYPSSTRSYMPNPRGLTEEQLYQLMKKMRGMSRQEFEKVYDSLETTNRFSATLARAVKADREIEELVKGESE